MRNKNGQLTIFIIVAILLVVALLLFYTLFQDQIRGGGDRTSGESTGSIESCINQEISDAVDLIFENGGYIEPTSLTMEFEFEDVPYLCYTARNYARCTPQISLMISHLEDEIHDYIESGVNICFEILKRNLKDKGYEVTLGSSQDIEVELVAGRVRVSVDRTLEQERSGEEKRFENFETTLKSPLYEMGIVTNKIVSQEASICNSDYVQLMEEHRDIEIKKKNTGDLNSIYTLKELDTEKEWRFAVRSCTRAIPG